MRVYEGECVRGQGWKEEEKSVGHRTAQSFPISETQKAEHFITKPLNDAANSRAHTYVSTSNHPPSSSPVLAGPKFRTWTPEKQEDKRGYTVENEVETK